MTRHEDQPQQVVTDIVIDRRIEVGHRHLLLRLELMAELLVLALEQLAAAHRVDRTILRRGHQPRARILWHARHRPFLECRDERILRQILRQADVADHARESGDHFRRLDSPNRVNRAMRFRCCHRGKSGHDHLRVQARRRAQRTGESMRKSLNV